MSELYGPEDELPAELEPDKPLDDTKTLGGPADGADEAVLDPEDGPA